MLINWIVLAVTGLVVEDGAVTGAEVLARSGRTIRVRARKGVVLAAGGFPHDPELRKRFLPFDPDGLGKVWSAINAENHLFANHCARHQLRRV